jgi:membrane-bound lytic murein transglycosylase A
MARVAAILLTALLWSCAQTPPAGPPGCPAAAPCPACPKCPAIKPAAETASYVETAFDALPGWSTVALEPSLRAFLAGCPRPGGATSPLARACEAARGVPLGDETAARHYFETTFQPYALASAEGSDTGLITGYYEPVIEGSRKQSAAHRFPVFGVPDDLVVVDLASVTPDVRHLRLRGRLEGRRLVPYASRAEIEARGLALGAPVIAWASNAVDLFFLHIQGSGQIRFPDGSRVRIGYADQNGHPFRSLGRHLVERGELKLEEASMQGIKAWAAANPARLQEALNQNPSYVFFRELPADGGPIGALGIGLTSEYSLAVDRRYVPLGTPVFLDTTHPLSEEPLHRLMAAHDTGGAIRGVVRADFFWGTGPEAGERAGKMRQQGRLWLLWPRGEAPPRQD